MNLSKELTGRLSVQMNSERYNSAMYFQMSALCDQIGLFGCSKFLKKQADDEQGHFKMIYDYIIDRNVLPEVSALPQPVFNYTAPMDMFTQVLNLEHKTTDDLTNIKEFAVTQRDYMTEHLMLKMLDEQVEEENIISDIISRFEAGGQTGASLLLVDCWVGGLV